MKKEDFFNEVYGIADDVKPFGFDENFINKAEGEISYSSEFDPLNADNLDIPNSAKEKFKHAVYYELKKYYGNHDTGVDSFAEFCDMLENGELQDEDFEIFDEISQDLIMTSNLVISIDDEGEDDSDTYKVEITAYVYDEYGSVDETIYGPLSIVCDVENENSRWKRRVKAAILDAYSTLGQFDFF